MKSQTPAVSSKNPVKELAIMLGAESFFFPASETGCLLITASTARLTASGRWATPGRSGDHCTGRAFARPRDEHCGDGPPEAARRIPVLKLVKLKDLRQYLI